MKVLKLKDGTWRIFDEEGNDVTKKYVIKDRTGREGILITFQELMTTNDENGYSIYYFHVFNNETKSFDGIKTIYNKNIRKLNEHYALASLKRGKIKAVFVPIKAERKTVETENGLVTKNMIKPIAVYLNDKYKFEQFVETRDADDFLTI